VGKTFRKKKGEPERKKFEELRRIRKQEKEWKRVRVQPEILDT
jgi:hypothetical protein